MINDLLVGLENLRDRHRQTQSLTQVSVLLFQSHQAASKEILVHLAHEKKQQTHRWRQLIRGCFEWLMGKRQSNLSKWQRSLALIILCQWEQVFNVLSFQKRRRWFQRFCEKQKQLSGKMLNVRMARKRQQAQLTDDVLFAVSFLCKDGLSK